MSILQMSCSAAIPEHKFNLDFSIEEIRNQLSTMGVTDLSSTELMRLKRHLDDVIRREQGLISNSQNRLSDQGIEEFTNTALSRESSTPRTSVSSSPILPYESDPIESNQAWRQPGPLKGTLYAPVEPGSLNSNQISLQSSRSNQLLTVPTMLCTTRRLGGHIRHSDLGESADCHIQRSASETNSSLDSTGQTPTQSDLKPVFVSATTPRIELSVRTASDASESAKEPSQPHQEVSSQLDTATIAGVKATGGRIKHILTKDEGDYEPDLNFPAAYPIGTKDPTKWDIDLVTDSNMLRCPALSGTHQNILIQRDGINSSKCVECCWGNAMSLSHMPRMSSDKTSVITSHSGPRKVTTANRNSGRTKNTEATRKPYSNSSELSVFHIHEVDRNKDWRSGAGNCTVARIDRRGKRNCSELFSDKNTTIRRSSCNRSPSNIRQFWTQSERSTCKMTRVPSPPSTSASRKFGHISRSERCSSRSARFPENPVAKIHQWHPRPRTASVGRSDSTSTRLSLSQPTKSSISNSTRARRQDPVTRYHSYQRSWLTHLVPGEDARRILRWNIKTAMMHREVPLLQRNLPEVTRLFGPGVAAMLTRERQQKLKSLNLDYIQSAERHQMQNRCRTTTVSRPGKSRSIDQMLY